MESSSNYLRYLVAGVFVAFIAYVVLADLWKRLPKLRMKPPRQSGFQRGTPIRPQESRRSNWKSGVRR